MRKKGVWSISKHNGNVIQFARMNLYLPKIQGYNIVTHARTFDLYSEQRTKENWGVVNGRGKQTTKAI